MSSHHTLEGIPVQSLGSIGLQGCVGRENLNDFFCLMKGLQNRSEMLRGRDVAYECRDGSVRPKYTLPDLHLFA